MTIATPDVATLDDEPAGALHRLRGRTGRRATVAVLLLLHAATVTLVALDGDREVVHRGAELAALGLSVGGYLVLRAVTHRLADEVDEALDERQSAVRDRAYLVAYRLLAFGVTLALFGVFIAVDGFDAVLGGRALNALFWAVLGLAIALPTFVVAWTEKDL